jgi:O-acetyl-ADP-ribose deacetylase (regulator of RNase III)
MDFPPARRHHVSRVDAGEICDSHRRSVKGVCERDAERLAASYRDSMTLAVQRGLRSIDFPAISTGIYGYPRDEAAAVAFGDH